MVQKTDGPKKGCGDGGQETGDRFGRLQGDCKVRPNVISPWR